MDDRPSREKRGPFNNPFARLGEQLGPLPEGPRREPEPARGPARAVVRLERKGRGGKQVTVVEQLELAPRKLARWLSDLQRSLGCGGAIDGNVLVLQGDCRERLRPLLAARGVRRITVG